ncbi:MAG: ribosome silencing factor [Bacteroidetes bacterium]|nr:ribosome silencing factor [Bacteroidota bacterium]
MKPATLAKHVADFALTKKAQDVVLMNLKGLSSVTDFFVVCSADSDVQVKAIAAAVEEGLKGKGVRPWQVERGSSNWVILDYVDVVLHVFHKHTRPFYNLEKLWGDAVIERVEDSVAEAATTARAKRREKAQPSVPAGGAVRPKSRPATQSGTRQTGRPRTKTSTKKTSSRRASASGKGGARRKAAS